MAAARRAVINRASRGWPPRLWSSVRATDRMFMQRYPEGERPVLPLRHEVAPCEGTRGWEGRLCRQRSSGRVLMARPRPVVRCW